MSNGDFFAGYNTNRDNTNRDIGKHSWWVADGAGIAAGGCWIHVDTFNVDRFKRPVATEPQVADMSNNNTTGEQK
jgi:hypothetical protein